MSRVESLNQDADLPSLQIFNSEIGEYRRTGRRLHLAHAARALDDARAELQRFLAQGSMADGGAAGFARYNGALR